ncbi:DNA-deoxyinosine glycosylase [Massilia litorea]|jgi:hypoxanthine-DNA glycosylase|uniref:DNA-deoxyinosine glycosylase n=1 Tax=Massilia litorea TaxID=2769491 RepID=A0A7L9UAK6_9BURK|nr:DNA-deoxyinosine glycosylase [Massilia litorea]QOL51282.1 DNA-deoxyinosine glycosylase [Massilia litorea]
MTTSAPIESTLLTGLAPVLAPGIRILILGSFPGARSLAAAQYYAHPRNQFWRLVSALVDEDLAALPYEQRLPRLLAHGIGLWDVLGACEREGSLDSAIRKPAANDFERLHALCPELKTVGFNGQASGKFAGQFEQAGYRTVVLPSSSPAHMALSFEQKLQIWRQLVASDAPDLPAPAQGSLL